MNRILPLVLLALVGCAKEKAPASSGTAKDGVTEDTKIPNDKNTKDFADKLIKRGLSDFKPGDTGAIQLTWNTIHFGPKNHFQAASTMTGDETFQCEETGDWEMRESAESDHKGDVWLHLNKSTCAGRPQTLDLRLVIDYRDSGAVDVVIH